MWPWRLGLLKLDAPARRSGRVDVGRLDIGWFLGLQSISSFWLVAGGASFLGLLGVRRLRFLHFLRRFLAFNNTFMVAFLLFLFRLFWKDERKFRDGFSVKGGVKGFIWEVRAEHKNRTDRNSKKPKQHSSFQAVRHEYRIVRAKKIG